MKIASIPGQKIFGSYTIYAYKTLRQR